MPSLSARVLVLAGLALAPVLAAPVAAEQAKPDSPARGAVEVSGQYRGYASRWMNVWLDDGTRLRFEVDDKAVPDWKKRFRFGERVTVTYLDLGSRRLPVVVGMKKAEAKPGE